MNRIRNFIVIFATALAIVCAALVIPLKRSEARGPNVALVPTPPPQTKKILVLLCKFLDHPEERHPASYYRDFFSSTGAGDRGQYDYWTEVSYGRMILDVTVTEWITVGMNQHEFTGPKQEAPGECARFADPPITNLGDYNAEAGGIVVVPNLPEAGNPTKLNPYLAELALKVEANDDTIEVKPWDPVANPFPAVPFTVFLSSTPGVAIPGGDGVPANGVYGKEAVNVTEMIGTTWTVERTRPEMEHEANTLVAFINVPRFQGGPGEAYLSDDVTVSRANQELIHLLGFSHSRKLSAGTSQEYGGDYDIAGGGYSASGIAYDPEEPFNGGNGGPGLNAVNLDLVNAYKVESWLGDRKESFDNSTCQAQTYNLAALNHPEVAGLPLTVLIPAAVPIPDGSGGTAATSAQGYYVEFRHKSGWDAGIPADSVLLHVDDGASSDEKHSYWVDTAGTNGVLSPESPPFADAANNAFVAVNRIDSTAMTATVTVGSCPISTAAGWSGDTSGAFSDEITLAADLTVGVSGAPIPNAEVSLTLGVQSCPAGTKTDSNGHASCTITLNQFPGAYTARLIYAGNDAYQPASVFQPFTIERETTSLTYTGALTGDYHDPAQVSATLEDPDGDGPIGGKTINFTLGVGDTCTAVTDGSGTASCTIVPAQPAGTVPLVASFAGDINYLPSDETRDFVITKEQTTTAYTGPLVILAGQPVTLSGRLLEEGTVPIQGRTLTLALGSQSCTGTTNAGGNASCTIASVNVALGPQPLSASFAGDAFYLPSSDLSPQAIVFAFPGSGAFTLGNLTVASATPATTVTWWGQAWSSLNSLSGGQVNSSFKGFAGILSSSPPNCGGLWSTSPGNSPPPAPAVPSYMGVLVPSLVSKSGNVFSGNAVKIVVVRANAGYAPNPMNAGTGVIVATYCG